LLLIASAVHSHAQVADIDFHLGISKIYEDCVDFANLKGYDSINVVTELGHREMVVRYKDNKLTQTAYLDTLNGYVMAMKSFKYSNSGLLEEIEQKESYDYNRYKQIVTDVQIKTMFKMINEHDSLGRLKKMTHVHFDYFRNGYDTDSIFADYTFSLGQLEIQANEPYGRKVIILFDDDGRVKSRVEYNRDREVINEWFFDYGQKRKLTATFNIHRDALDDEPTTSRSFSFVVTYDKKGVPTKFFDGKKTLYFKYY
jgi:hypothetical protein